MGVQSEGGYTDVGACFSYATYAGRGSGNLKGRPAESILGGRYRMARGRTGIGSDV